MPSWTTITITTSSPKLTSVELEEALDSILEDEKDYELSDFDETTEHKERGYVKFDGSSVDDEDLAFDILHDLHPAFDRAVVLQTNNTNYNATAELVEATPDGIDPISNADDAESPVVEDVLDYFQYTHGFIAYT